MISVTQQTISNVEISTVVLPTLLQGIAEKADKWGNDGKNGRIDPFTEIYDVGFLWHVFLGPVPNLPFSVRVHHDRPYDHLP